MHVEHEGEDPDSGVDDRLLETLPGGSRLDTVDVVALQAVVGKLTLLGGEPASGQGRVGEEGIGANGHETGNGPLLIR